MKATSEKGQSLVFVALGLTMLMGVMGLAVDMGYLRYMKRQMQTAADAAAVAAAGEIDFNITADLQNAGKKAAANNGFTDGTNGVSVTITHPPPAGDPHAGNNYFVEAKVTQAQPTFFARMFGMNSVPMTTRAVAAEGSGNNCIFALAPTGPGLTVAAFATVTSPCGVVVESSGSNAISCVLFASINVSSIAVVGNVGSFLCSITPTPRRIAVPVPADPLASWAAAHIPASAGCGPAPVGPVFAGSNAKLLISGVATLLPGIYCGGIQFAPGANATLTPGVYVLKSTNAAGGAIASPYGLTVDVGASVNGNGVTFYNFGPNGGINFLFAGIFAGAGVNLRAPTSGAYEGVLFYQPTSNSIQAQIVGTSSFFTTLEGTYYFPSASVNFAFAGPVNYNILVANRISFVVLTLGGTSFNTSGFQQSYNTLANGSPVKGGYGVLVE